MHAYVLTSFDTPPEHQDVADPEPGPGEIRVRVQATSVNPVDDLVRRGFFRVAQEYRFPAVYGRDAAGVVDRVGPGASRFQEGDEVFGFVKRDYIGDGTFAEFVVVPEGKFFAPRPRAVSMLECGTLGLAGVTALECVEAVLGDRADIVLINGAAGGLGTFAVQIAKAHGATVIAAAHSTAGLHHAQAIGADAVIDVREGDLVGLVRAVAPQGVTGFVDLVKRADPPIMGENETDAHREFARLCHAVLSPGGRATSVTNGGQPHLMPDVHYLNVHSTPTPDALGRLASLVETGAVRPVIEATYAFEDIADAFDRLNARGVRGKVAVSVTA